MPTTAEQLQVPIERNNHFLAFLQWMDTIEAQYNRGDGNWYKEGKWIQELKEINL